MLAIVGMLAISFVAELEGASIPMLVLVQNGVGAKILTPIISILMILGAVSTGVNMVAGIVTRSVNAVERRMGQKEKGNKMLSVGFSFVYTLIAFGIAQFGLMNVVSKGYAYLGYASLISVGIPFLIYFIVRCVKKKA